MLGLTPTNKNITYTGSQNIHTNSNLNLEELKKGYNISNLNFKSLKNLHLGNNKNKSFTGNDFSSITLPNDNNCKDSLYESNIKNNLVKKNHTVNNFYKNKHNRSYSQNNLNNDNIFLENNKNISPILNKLENKIIKTDYSHIEDDVHSLKIIIKNLENELHEKKDEIKILTKNFKEKINLIEIENKKTIDEIEKENKIVFNKIQQNNLKSIQELKEENLNSKFKYEEIIKKILREMKTIKQTTFPVYLHNQNINEIYQKYCQNLDKMKLSYNNKIKEIIQNFESPEYYYLIQRLNYFNKHKEKLEEILKVTDNLELKDILDNLDNNYNFNEVSVYLDMIKLKMFEADKIFKIESNEIILNYENIDLNFKINKKDKFEELKEIVNNKFNKIEKIYSYIEDKNNFDFLDEELIKLLNNKNTINNLSFTKKENKTHNILNESDPHVVILPNSKDDNPLRFNSSTLKNIQNNFNYMNSNPLQFSLKDSVEMINAQNEFPLNKDNFNTFKKESINKSITFKADRIEMENVNLKAFDFSDTGVKEKENNNKNNLHMQINMESPSLFETDEIVVKKKISVFSQEVKEFFINNDESDLRRPSKILFKQHNILDYKDDDINNMNYSSNDV